MAKPNRIALLAKLGYEVNKEYFTSHKRLLRKNKYGAKPTGGYASKKEHDHAVMLRIKERAGLISNLREQVSYELIPAQEGEKPCRYIADFVYTDNETGQTVVEDTKGVLTDVYKIKRKLMLYVHGIRIKEV